MKLGDQVVKLPAPDAFTTSTFRKGFSGELSGIRTMFTNQLPVLTVGTRAATAEATVNGANQNVDYASVAKAGTSNGLHMTQTLILNNAGVKTYKAGEVFTLPGVFAYDNRKQAAVTPARLQQFTVISDATAAAGAVTLTIFPAMIVPARALAITSTSTPPTRTSRRRRPTRPFSPSSVRPAPRFRRVSCFQKQAIVVNTVPLILPASDTSMRRRLTKVPLTVRMWQHSDFFTGAHGVRFDVALNANIRERLRIARVNGS
jgi:hypothetical protein